MYKSLSDGQKLIVPILFCLIFVFFYLKYRHDKIPKILLKSNLVLSLASIVLFIYELVKQNNYEQFIDNFLYPFILADVWVLAYTVGAVGLLRGCFLYPKYKEKRMALYFLCILLTIIVACYVAARILFTK